MQSLSHLSDHALLEGLHVIAGSHRRVTAELILHLGEVDSRRLHLEQGYSSLFSYSVEELRFSEDEACRRIEAARLARRFPAVYALLETAAISLTVLGLLKTHLTDDNHRELLAGVSRSSVKQAKEWIATRFPQPDVPSSIRKLAEHRPTAVRLPPRAATGVTAPSDNTLPSAVPGLGALLPAPTRVRAEPSSQDRSVDAMPPPAPTRVQVNVPSLNRSLEAVSPPAPTRARIEPLSRDRFLVKFTASRAMKDKLEHARDLMRHANPGGDIAVVLERAMDLLIAELGKTKQGRTNLPRKKARPAKNSHVTRAARREVVGRDGWRCSFVAESGRRCDARGFLEFDHETPKGRGGTSDATNLRVLCRAHNRLAAERSYGKGHVAQAISAAGGPLPHEACAPPARTSRTMGITRVVFFS